MGGALAGPQGQGGVGGYGEEGGSVPATAYQQVWESRNVRAPS